MDEACGFGFSDVFLDVFNETLVVAGGDEEFDGAVELAFSASEWTCLRVLSSCFSRRKSLLQALESGSDRRHFRICSIAFSVSPIE